MRFTITFRGDPPYVSDEKHDLYASMIVLEHVTKALQELPWAVEQVRVESEDG